MVATPCHGGELTVAYVISALALQRNCLERGIGISFNLRSGEALITRARADMVAEFLASDATHLLFIDADVAETRGGEIGLEGSFVGIASVHTLSTPERKRSAIDN